VSGARDWGWKIKIIAGASGVHEWRDVGGGVPVGYMSGGRRTRRPEAGGSDHDRIIILELWEQERMTMAIGWTAHRKSSGTPA
jgi:hypothetical protein